MITDDSQHAASIRIVDPLLPQSRTCPVGCSPLVPTPSTWSTLSDCRIETPSEVRQETVVAQSAPVAKLEMVELPSARAAMIAARCEMDLSPGRRTCPTMRRAGRILIAAMIPQRQKGSRPRHFPYFICHLSPFFKGKIVSRLTRQIATKVLRDANEK